MKTNIVVGVVVVVALVVFGYFFFGKDMMKGSSISVNTENTTEETSSTSQESGKKMAFSEFIKQGGSYKCTVNQNVGNTVSVGTTYINGDMIRGEYNTKAQGISIDTTLIVRDGYTYTWTSFAPTMGFKSKVATGGMEDGSTGMSGTYSFNAEQIGDYDCQAWNVDASLFVIPTSITFKEV